MTLPRWSATRADRLLVQPTTVGLKSLVAANIGPQFESWPLGVVDAGPVSGQRQMARCLSL